MSTGIQIIDDTYVEETSEVNYDDKWDRADTYTSHDIRGFVINEKYNDLLLGFKLEKDIDYYLVYVVYSTGDSFGHDSGYGIEYIDMYKTYEEATKVQKALENESPEFKYGVGENMIQIKNHMGQDYDLYTGAWKGYFESVDNIDIATIRLQ